jgi:hypothetical protein
VDTHIVVMQCGCKDAKWQSGHPRRPNVEGPTWRPNVDTHRLGGGVINTRRRDELCMEVNWENCEWENWVRIGDTHRLLTPFDPARSRSGHPVVIQIYRSTVSPVPGHSHLQLIGGCPHLAHIFNQWVSTSCLLGVHILHTTHCCGCPHLNPHLNI